jgi:HD-GYP domain-containing protein (c-di-GMP phosphodiesterase class II)
MGRAETSGVTSPASFWSRRPRASWAGLYIVGLGVLALGLLCLLAYSQAHVPYLQPPGSFSWSGLVLLMAVGIFAEKYTVRIGSGMEVSASFLAFFLSAAIAGPLASFLCAVASQIPLVRRGELERGLCFSSALGLVSGATALFYWTLLAQFREAGVASPLQVALVGLGAGVFFMVLNFGVFLPVGLLRHAKGPITIFREGFVPFLPFHFFFLAISLGLIYIYRLYVLRDAGASGLYSTALIMLCLLPVFGSIYAFRAYAHQRELAVGNARLALQNERWALRNERLALQAVASQVTALDLKDNYTARHSAAVARWATDIAETLKLSEHEVNVTHLASLMHDVGKIGVPDEVLNFAGRLDPVGWALVETHCQNGHKILGNIDQFDELANVVLYHHERYDGTGYPRGIAGEEIPLISRIICVADSYSAMVSDRPYRKRLSTDIAKSELALKKGTQFDPEVADCFLTLLEQRDDDYQRGEQVDFHVEFQKVKFLRELPPETEDEETAAAGVGAQSGAAA